MKQFSFNKMIWYVNVVVSVICLSLVSHTLAQSGGQYELSWSTIDGGGGRSSGGDFTLTGTIGQPDAAYSSGGNYELLGGFWPGGPLCIVSFDDYARFAEWWLEPDCNKENNWCGGADFEPDGDVDFVDLERFVAEWLCYCPVGWPLK